MAAPQAAPLASLLLAHGAGSGPWVFQGWAETFQELEVEAVDLQAGLNVAEASMSNYAAVIVRAAECDRSQQPLCGTDDRRRVVGHGRLGHVQACLEIDCFDLQFWKRLGPALEDPRPASRAVGEQQRSYVPQRRNWTVWFPRARHSRSPP